MEQQADSGREPTPELRRKDAGDILIRWQRGRGWIGCEYGVCRLAHRLRQAPDDDVSRQMVRQLLPATRRGPREVSGSGGRAMVG